MRYAIMSDVHANPVALKAALADARENGAESVVCLGDVVGYGPDPVEAVALCRAECDVVLLGNHDAAVAGAMDAANFIPFAQDGVRRHEAALSAADKKWLAGLPYLYSTRSFLCAHGTLVSPESFFYMYDAAQIVESFSIMAQRRRRLLFVGHTHHACFIVCSRTKKVRAFAPAAGFSISPKASYIVNVGSVGYPRADHDITYAIYDSGARRVEFRHLPFDFSSYANRLKERGIVPPLWLSDYMSAHGPEQTSK